MAAPNPVPPVDNPAGVRLALSDVARDYGSVALDDARLIGRLLPDLLGVNASRESALIIAAASGGVARLLGERLSLGLPVPAAIRDVSAMLAASSLLQPHACDWIVAEYALALGSDVAAETFPTASPATWTPAPSVQPPSAQPPTARPHAAQPVSAQPVSAQPVSPAWPVPPAAAAPAAPPPYAAPTTSVQPAAVQAHYAVPAQHPTTATPGYAGYPRAGGPTPGHAVPGYPMPATGPVPRQGARIAAACIFFLMGVVQFYPSGYSYYAQYVTIIALATLGYASLGVYLLVNRFAVELLAAIVIAFVVLRMEVAPLLSDSFGYRFLYTAVVFNTLLLFTVAVLVLLAVGESGPAGGRADPAGRRRRPPLVTLAGWLMLGIALFEFYYYAQISRVDEWLVVPLALGVLLLRGSQFGRIVAWLASGFAVLLDTKFLVLASNHPYSYAGWYIGYLLIESLLFIVVAVLLALPAAHPYFRRAAPVAAPQVPPGPSAY